jgi:DNA transformation protein
MFGGTGIYRDGLIFALAIDDAIYLKTDADCREAFKAAGAHPFSYMRKDGRRAEMTYYSLPEEALDDPDRLASWAELAYSAALRAKERKR